MESILKITVCIAAGLFGALHLAAAASQLQKGFRPTHLLMALGGLGAIAAVAGCLAGWASDWLLMLIGGGMACCAAVWNGTAASRSGSGAFHLSHHVIRIALALLLTLAFTRV